MRELLNLVLVEARGMWRFRWYGLLVAWLIVIGGTGYVYALPDEYKADAWVSVDTESVLQPLLDGLAVQPDVQTQVRMMTDTLLTRPNVEKIARETGQLLKATSAAEEARIVERLSDRLRLRSASRDDIYIISYTHESPEMARDVVQEAVNVLLETTLSSTRTDSSSAREFLQEQVREYEKRLQEAEQRLAKFKRENTGLLPSQGSDYYDRLSSAQDELTELRNQLDSARGRERSIRAEIRAMRQGAAGSQAESERVRTLRERVDQHEERLNDLLLRYTDKHPDVRALRDRLDRLRKELKQARNAPGAMVSDAELADNPVYQELRIQLNEVTAEIASLEPKIRQQEERIADLKSRVDRITDVEARLSSLTRDYDVTRQQYEELLTRLNSAKLSNDASSKGGQGRFRVVEPPVAPQWPDGPDRVLMLSFVLAFSFGAGGGLSFVLNQIQPVFLTRRALQQITGRPVLGTVSRVMTVGEQRRVARKAAVFFSMALALAALMGVCILFASEGAAYFQTWLEGLPL